jgi:hypothetical protein
LLPIANLVLLLARPRLLNGGASWRKKTEDWHAEAGRCTGSLITDSPEGWRAPKPYIRIVKQPV